MQKKSKTHGVILLIVGVLFGLFLIFSYFVSIPSVRGGNYYVWDSLLGIIIFHNLFVFIVYILILILLIFFGIKKLNT